MKSIRIIFIWLLSLISTSILKAENPKNNTVEGLNTSNSQYQTPNEIINGHEAVDLGLSVKWATCNIGAATKPLATGDFFSWGETTTKSNYDYDILCYTGGNVTFGDISGSEFDAATQKWGGSWRMPNLEEANELVAKCQWEWMTINGTNLYKVTGPNGNYIFLPAGGYAEGTTIKDRNKMGCFWTSTRKVADYNVAFSIMMLKDPSLSRNWVVSVMSRPNGLPIRPVTGKGIQDDSSFLSVVSGKSEGHDYVDLGLSVKWATCNIGADSPEEYGDYYARGESRTKDYYTDGDYSLYGENIDRKIKELSGSEYDTARKKWGGNWRIPTLAEAKELIEKCKWKFIRIKRHYGYKVTGPNGNSIFIPSAGYIGMYPEKQEAAGLYWTSAPVIENTYGRIYYTDEGYTISLVSGANQIQIGKAPSSTGVTIRPVL